jgi:hypothetical protein
MRRRSIKAFTEEGLSLRPAGPEHCGEAAVRPETRMNTSARSSLGPGFEGPRELRSASEAARSPSFFLIFTSTSFWTPSAHRGNSHLTPPKSTELGCLQPQNLLVSSPNTPEIYFNDPEIYPLWMAWKSWGFSTAFTAS